MVEFWIHRCLHLRSKIPGESALWTFATSLESPIPGIPRSWYLPRMLNPQKESNQKCVVFCLCITCRVVEKIYVKRRCMTMYKMYNDVLSYYSKKKHVFFSYESPWCHFFWSCQVPRKAKSPQQPPGAGARGFATGAKKPQGAREAQGAWDSHGSVSAEFYGCLIMGVSLNGGFSPPNHPF